MTVFADDAISGTGSSHLRGERRQRRKTRVTLRPIASIRHDLDIVGGISTRNYGDGPPPSDPVGGRSQPPPADA